MENVVNVEDFAPPPQVADIRHDSNGTSVYTGDRWIRLFDAVEGRALAPETQWDPVTGTITIPAGNPTTVTAIVDSISDNGHSIRLSEPLNVSVGGTVAIGGTSSGGNFVISGTSSGDHIEIPVSSGGFTVPSAPANPANSDWWDAGSVSMGNAQGAFKLGDVNYSFTTPAKDTERAQELDLALTGVLISLKQALDAIPKKNTEAREIIIEEIMRVEDILGTKNDA